jgi:O-antigen chain-terminating methyltransferase
MNEAFYRAFEERYRGSRDVIKSRLRIYLPFIGSLSSFYSELEAVDLGCGRGEWLELLKEAGFDAQGVDLDDNMLAVCRDIGLKVHTQDAIEFLEELPDESQVLVSGFHIAEHMEFANLQALVQQAFRVLKPMGLLILETPNPENIVVGSSSFYLDPTHQRPLPPLLLAFLPEYYGFARVKILRLQEVAGLINNNATTLLEVLNGVSPDYAVVAQKSAAPALQSVNSTELEWQKDYGLSLQTLAQQYENRVARAERAEATWEKIRGSSLWRTLLWIRNRLKKINKDVR